MQPGLGRGRGLGLGQFLSRGRRTDEENELKRQKISSSAINAEAINILLLENIHPVAEESFRTRNFGRMETHPGALAEEQLLKIMPDVNILGIRSKTHITERVLQSASQLMALGCFCIGTDQVDMEAATRHGVAVFNAPFSNTRSVAELTIAEVVMLARRAVQRSMELHGGRWEKSAKGCVEVRRKTIGIIGYGHIGPQVGLLAESLGMRVVFHDIVKKLPLGNARQVSALEELLKISDFVTLHVPDTPQTRRMISHEQLSMMPQGSYLLNLSRGSVIDIEALHHALKSGHLAGAAVDVFPKEPNSGKDPFNSELRGLENVILTPHIGGSTEEAQRNIGLEVSDALISYVENGSSDGCANLPEAHLPPMEDSYRILNIHTDVPGVLSRINGLIAKMSVNIKAQSYNTRNGVGYLIMDVERSLSRKIGKQIESLDSNIRTRLLF
ncbi:MAG: phosphoglycerate dehydrogenase [Acidobacteria bacterium]|nr:phosphoglycerate dehydrogenase [Acidobacteriota bacterium]